MFTTHFLETFQRSVFVSTSLDIFKYKAGAITIALEVYIVQKKNLRYTILHIKNSPVTII